MELAHAVLSQNITFFVRFWKKSLIRVMGGGCNEVDTQNKSLIQKWKDNNQVINLEETQPQIHWHQTTTMQDENLKESEENDAHV